ncbi:helix-turn-helix transcriptional regulator [Fusobacterium animalis]|uniref:helix-turn-helix domain-containing protein n=1 Tax=Fusobacterium animalis TaxID=76859 RepID=UPI0030D3E4A3
MTRLDFEMEVKRVLREKGITQAELSKLLGITPSYCSDIIRGNRNGGDVKKKND